MGGPMGPMGMSPMGPMGPLGAGAPMGGPMAGPMGGMPFGRRKKRSLRLLQSLKSKSESE